MGVEEFNRWKDFEALYDLPDAYLVAGQLGALVNNIMGGKARPQDFAHYYEPDRKLATPPPVDTQAVAASKAFVQSLARRKGK